VIGKVLGGRYEIVRRIASGGMATLYKANCTYLLRPVAVKVLKEELARDSEFLARFRREARAAARLSHPNVVGIYDVGQHQGIHYIVMEYVEGRTLKEVIAQDAPLPVSEAVAVGRAMLDALSAAHAQGIVHRDIKPQNILLDKFSRVKVADFGIARAPDAATLVSSDKIMGSAHYMSPEQAKGRFTDARSDLYSAGVVLYEMLTGHVPFDGDSTVEVALRHMREEPVSPRRRNPDISPALAAIVMRALSKDPGARYSSAEAMKADLERFASGETPRALLAQHGQTAAVETSAVNSALETGGGVRDSTSWPLGEERAMAEATRPRRAALAWLLVLLVSLGSTAYAGYLVWDWFTVPPVEVPLVEGERIEAAQSILQEHGLNAEIVGSQHHDEIPANYVISQNPHPGETTRRGRAVELTISQGPEWVQNGVPYVVGLHKAQAEIALENVGLQAQISWQYSDEVPEECVIEQVPVANTRVQKGTTVYLEVSQGPEPTPFALPGVVGSKVDQALERLTSLGLETRILYENADYPVGTVADQDPQAGTEVKPGDTVTLVVSRGGNAQASTAVLTIKVPAEPDAQQIRVEIIDQKSQRVIYENQHHGGDEFELEVFYYGGAIVRVYSDGQQVGDDRRIVQ